MFFIDLTQAAYSVSYDLMSIIRVLTVRLSSDWFNESDVLMLASQNRVSEMMLILLTLC